MAAKASGVLTLDTAPFIKSLEAAKVALKGFATAVAAIALTAVAGFAVLGVGVFKIVSAFKEGIVAAFQFGKEMNAAARQMQGVGVGDLFLIQKALEKGGMSADEARSSLKEISETGRDWSDLWKTPLDAANALAAASADFGPMADALDKGAQAISVIRNIIDSLNMKFATFFQAFLAEIVEPLQYLLQKINDAFDLSQIGTKLGGALSLAMDEWIGGASLGNLMAVVAAQLKLAFIDGFDYLSIKFNQLKEILTGDKAKAMFEGAKDIFIGLGLILKSYIVSAGQIVANMLQEGALNNAWANKQKAMAGTEGTEQNKTARAAQNEMFDLKHEIRRVGFAMNTEGKSMEEIEAVLTPLRRKYELAQLKKEYAMGGDKYGNMSYGERTSNPFYVPFIDAGGGTNELREGLDLLKKGTKEAFGTPVVDVIDTITGSREEAQETLDYAKYTAGLEKDKNKKDKPESVAAPYLAGKPFEALTTSLGKIGGGGGSFLTSQTAQEQRQIQALKNQINLEKLTGKVIENTDPENPKAVAKGPVMLP